MPTVIRARVRVSDISFLFSFLPFRFWEGFFVCSCVILICILCMWKISVQYLYENRTLAHFVSRASAEQAFPMWVNSYIRKGYCGGYNPDPEHFPEFVPDDPGYQSYDDIPEEMFETPEGGGIQVTLKRIPFYGISTQTTSDEDSALHSDITPTGMTDEVTISCIPCGVYIGTN